MTTQNEELLKYLKRHPRGITVWVAYDQLGITSLHTRIRELEQSGHAIERNSVVGKNRYGNTCKVTRYRLKHA